MMLIGFSLLKAYQPSINHLIAQVGNPTAQVETEPGDQHAGVYLEVQPPASLDKVFAYSFDSHL